MATETKETVWRAVAGKWNVDGAPTNPVELSDSSLAQFGGRRKAREILGAVATETKETVWRAVAGNSWTECAAGGCLGSFVHMSRYLPLGQAVPQPRMWRHRMTWFLTTQLVGWRWEGILVSSHEEQPANQISRSHGFLARARCRSLSEESS